MAIVLSPPRIDGSRVTVQIAAGAASAYLRSGPMWAEYDVDLAGVDPALLVLPALGTVLPIAYAAGTTVQVDSVDREFAAAAEDLASVWSAMYAGFARPGGFRLTGAQVESQAAPGALSQAGPGTAGTRDGLLLYSGGLDCSASLLVNADRIGSLLSVWGVDVPLADRARWRALRSAIGAGPLTAGRRMLQVRTNCRSVVRGARLGHEFLRDRQWWAHVHHGIQLLTLAAPVSAAVGASTVYIAASLTAASLEPWGSTPATDNRIRWTGTRVVHDCFELDRQQKTRRLAESGVFTAGHRLAVCFQPTGEKSPLNCGRCEKCLRTATGLMVAGIDPDDAGLHIAAGRFAALREEPGRSPTMAANPASWRAVQAGIPDDLGTFPAAVRDHLAWLRGQDLSPADRSPDATARSRSRWVKEMRYRVRVLVEALPGPVQHRLRVWRSARRSHAARRPRNPVVPAEGNPRQPAHGAASPSGSSAVTDARAWEGACPRPTATPTR